MPKVLLVEDNEMNRDMLSRRLARRGFDVLEAVDGQQGIEMARKDLPDIIVMDMSLPVVDGWEAARRIRAEKTTRCIPLIALTAHAMSDDRQKALEAGCDDYDTKPVDLSRLLEKMNRLLVSKPAPSATEPLTGEALLRLRHDLKTSFNQIIGYTEVVLEDLGKNRLEKIEPELSEILSGARALLVRIDKDLTNEKGVLPVRLHALESEVRPEAERLYGTCELLIRELRSMGAQEPLADLERVLSAVRLLLSLIRQMRRETDREPAETRSSVARIAEESASPSSRGAGRLLIVEDDVANRDLLRRRLAGHGYSVEVAGDGSSALDKISRAQYDLVLLDQMMPGMSGLDLLKLLRGTYSASELPVIMVTAVDQSETIVEALDEGANDYVAKPVDLPVVMARIQAQLARSKADRHTKFCDPLTGLTNRILLTARLAEAIAGAPATPGTARLAVLLLDLDGFKVVNDGFGHGAGDQLLIEVAERLKNTVRERRLESTSTVARIGGDEFVILLDQLSRPEQAAEVAEAILSCLARPLALQGLQVTVTGSLGIALCGAEGATPEQLLRDADLAMYRAKELGKNRWQMFDPSLHARVQARMAAAIDLRHALEQGELLAYYQPKVHLRSRAMLGFEALLRWRHPTRGLLPPAEFISVAEETGLIVPMGEWILGEACRQLAIWQKRFPAPVPLTMSVNLSVKQLKDPNLVNYVRQVLAETGIPPETLRLELTESYLMAEIESAKDVLAGIQDLRVGLKLDDFGTGYSSLSYLRALHFDSLKIDRTFVERLETDAESRAIVETIIQLANALRMNVVAEGIEDEHQLGELIRLGCEMGQGFLFSHPLGTADAEELLNNGLSGSMAAAGLPPALVGETGDLFYPSD
jgi:diguanylate cyclase (GGDEF)-like protein